MKSTIKIALGDNNQPVIKMMAVDTDDIRDQLCRQWCEVLQGDSQLCQVMFTDNQHYLPSVDVLGNNQNAYKEVVITPLAPYSYFLNHLLIEEIYRYLSAGNEYIAMVTGGDHIRFDDTVNKKMSAVLNREDLRKMNIVELTKVITDNFNELL